MSGENIGKAINDQEVEIQEYYLRGILNGGKEPLVISQAALELAIRAHGDTRRDDGSLYISHPIGMACLAIGLGIRDDKLIATLLLHDVCEDCGIPVQSVSEDSDVRQAVRLMTIKPGIYDSVKADTKRRYFESLLESCEALIGKAFDRVFNLESGIEVFDRARSLKNWRETYHLLLPITKIAKRNWPEWSDTLHVLRCMLKTNLNYMKALHKFTDEEMFSEYGTMEFEKKPVKPANGILENNK
ncbi:MAG: HD domain-containing protein [Candidatus Saccharibacteria bacterium]|nr:HD domain-containing protein [Candidatus Saccharibacteria bacterium]